jgi:hypothetical protein
MQRQSKSFNNHLKILNEKLALMLEYADVLRVMLKIPIIQSNVSLKCAIEMLKDICHASSTSLLKPSEQIVCMSTIKILLENGQLSEDRKAVSFLCLILNKLS